MFARPGLPSFEYVRALQPSQVVDILREHGQDARLLMGGTDLFPSLRDGALHPQFVIDLKQLPGLGDIVYTPSQGLTVGAAVTMNRLASHPVLLARYSLLSDAARSVASYQIRNRATLGGNLCNASPCADTSPATLVLEAEFVLQGPDAARLVPATEFFVGPGKTVLRPDEFMTAIRFPLPPVHGAATYQKLGRCRSGDLSLVGVAVLGYPDPSSVSGYRFRIGLGSVAPTPLRASLAEEHLAAQPPGESAFAIAAEKARAASNPITDVRGTAEYQQAMVQALTLRALKEVWARLKEAD
ncbi:MAG: FAD binding domain-containing protein [Anaerolineae bacterium]